MRIPRTAFRSGRLARENLVNISDKLLNRIDRLKKSYLEGLDAPKVVIEFPGAIRPCSSELMKSPETMLKWELRNIEKRMEAGDDYLPQIRVEFGSIVVGSAFGCGVYLPENDYPCIKSHVLTDASLIETLHTPPVDAGYLKKAYEFTEYFFKNKPDWVELALLDFQGPYNNAHLVRGNDILLDFYDCPESVESLLDKMADYQIQLTRHYRAMTGMADGCLYDYGIAWKGNGRICNCSLHMINPKFYDQYIKKSDARVADESGGIHIHYCGSYDNGVLESICGIPGVNSLEVDASYHDMWALSAVMPKDMPLMVALPEAALIKFLEKGAPLKDNLIIRWCI